MKMLLRSVRLGIDRSDRRAYANCPRGGNEPEPHRFEIILDPNFVGAYSYIHSIDLPDRISHQPDEGMMLRKHIRYAVLAAGVVAVGAPAASHVYAQTVRCYFKDCIVFADGSRMCEVKEVPCPNES